MVFRVQLRASVLSLVVLLLLLLDELLNTHGVNVFEFFFVDVLDWIAFVLKKMDEVHDLFLS